MDTGTTMAGLGEMPDGQQRGRCVRAAGGLYLLLTVTSIFSFIVPKTLIVAGDATATVKKLLDSETLFRFALVAGLVAAVSFVFLVVELYRLLNGINKAHATLMVILALLSIPIAFVNAVTQVGALTLIHGGTAFSGLDTSQVNALAMFLLSLGSDINAVNSIFFGLWLLPFGLLVIRSGFIPRVLGFLLIVAGAAYLVGSLNFLLSPPYARVISSIALVGYFGELGIVAWLAAKAAQVQFSRRLTI